MSENPFGNNGIPEEQAPGGTQNEASGGFTGESTGAGATDAGTTGGTKTAAEASWQEVGHQFQVLGQSIAQAMRTAWENEETQKQLREMRSGLESMVKEVGKAIEDSANTPQGQKIRTEAGKAAQSVKTAGEQTVQEVRPHLVNTLKQLNEELQKLIDRWENKNQQP